MPAEVSFSTEGVVVISALLGALTGAVGYIFKLLIASKDAQIAMALAAQKLKEEESAKKSYQEIAEEAVLMAEARVNQKREREGKAPTKVVAPIVPEHSSPVTPEQQETADLQTLRARVTAATLALGLPPRESASPEAPAPAQVPTVTADELKAAIEDVKADVAEIPAKVKEVLTEPLGEP